MLINPYITYNQTTSLYFAFLNLNLNHHLLLSFFLISMSSPFFLIFIFLLLPLANSISFNIPRFDPHETNIIYQGDAKAVVGDIELNSVDYLFQVGRATYADSLHLWDSASNLLTHFTTKFSFVIDTFGSAKYAAGLAFFLAPVGYPIPPNSGGGFLGLFNTTTSDSAGNQIVLLEFDTFSNGWDPPVQHVGINKNSISSAVYTPWNASSHTGDTADVIISYNGTTNNLTMSWTYSNNSNPRERSSLSYQVDLREVLPEWVTIGFSAATSHYVERHRVRSWEFSSSLEIKKRNGESAGRIRLVVILSVFVSLLAAGVTVAVWIIVRRKQRRRQTSNALNLTSMNNDLERGAGPRRFSYSDLESATHNFSGERKLGEGGFGAVYKGYLIDLDMAVAVKKISRGSRQGKKEYVTEVKVISQLRHRNLVQLIGWCHDRGEFLLVYEFMPKGSLDAHLFGKKSSLAWASRYRIALGLASALLYLHEEWEQCVVHRDIKSSNIMLDSGFNVKLGDFGLARLMDHELGPQTTTGLAGTLGYMAPEYISTGRANKESDVFSFGVVALEIATGRKSVNPMLEESEMGLVEWVWDLYGRQELLLAADGKMSSDMNENQIECLMVAGLWCAHPDHRSRPTIRQALQLLNFEIPMPNLPATMPVPIYHVPRPLGSFGATFRTGSISDDTC